MLPDSALKHRELFQSLTDPETPKAALGASVGLHGVLLFLLIVLPLLAPQALRVTYNMVALAPPPPPPRKVEPVELKLPPRRPIPEPIVAPEIAEAPPLVAPRPAPRPEPRILEPVPKPAAPAVSAAAPALLEPKPAPGVAAPAPPPVVTNVFSNVTQPAITAAPARSTEVAGFGPLNPNREVSKTPRPDAPLTGGFGESSGNRENTRTARTEVTTGSGFGDAGGSGDRARPGRSGAVASAGGFDAAGSGGGARPSPNRETVTASGFNSAAPAARTAPPPPKVPEGPIEKPVEILVKPRPDYTDEARKAKIEGEVVLRVLFTSTGEARVLDLVNGLGYGLNDNAIKAAGQIKFKPAQRAGQPVDFTAIVHIVFQLAY